MPCGNISAISGRARNVPPELLCPICNALDTPLRFAQCRLPIRKCSCGMEFLWPQLGEEQLKEIYQAGYYESCGLTDDNDRSVRNMKQATFMRWLKQLTGVVPVGKVLDVGCATGYFLEVAASAGWDVYGVELSEYAAGLAQRRFGNHVFSGSIEQANYPDNSFDLVTLFDLLEHVPSPRTFLKEVWRLLSPKAFLMITTPDVTSLSARLMGRHWSHYHQDHLYYFSPDTITRLLHECGFSVVGKAAAAKYLNGKYIINQFRAYPHFLMTPLCNIGELLLPKLLKESNFSACSGDMVLLAQKTKRG